MTIIPHPLDFIAALDSSSTNSSSKPIHIALFYEDEEYARQIEYSFLRNGLAKSQHCIYTTHGDIEDNKEEDDDEEVESIRAEMIRYGIDVEKFEQSGFLHIVKISNLRNDPSGFFEKEIKNLKSRIIGEEEEEEKSLPIRLVCNFMRTIENEDDAKASMLLERTIHSCLLEFQGQIMCPYDIDKVPSQINVEWFLNHMQHHHAAIFAPRSFEGSGLVLDGQ